MDSESLKYIDIIQYKYNIIQTWYDSKNSYIK